MATAPKALIFDLGGVIVRWTGIEALMEMTGRSRSDVLQIFKVNPIFQAYEIGRCDDDRFAAAMIESFNLDMDTVSFKRLWQSWVGQTYPDTKRVLAALRESFVTACLSNTNALHWERLKQFIETEDYFDYSFASHLIHAAKPTLESYTISIEKMGLTTSDIWFFDDTKVNIRAAQNFGIQAFHVDRNVGVLPTLERLELI